MKVQNYLLIVAVLILTGCKYGDISDTDLVETSFQAKSKLITFRVNSKKGDRYTDIQLANGQIGKSPSPFTIKTKMECELLTVENDRFTWKCFVNEKAELKGNKYREGKGPANNRLVLTTINSYGNLISQEGQSADAGAKYNEFPEKAVKIGDTWEGYMVHDNHKYKNSYSLNSLVTINGKDYAVVICKAEEVGGGSSTTKSWIDLSTGLQHKTEFNGSSVNAERETVTVYGSSHVVDAREQPLLR